MKKILFIITKGSPFGGAQRYVYDLAVNLPREEFEPLVACGEGDALPQALEKNGVRVIRIPDLERDISIPREWRTLKLLLKLIGEEKPDIIHLNSSKIGGLGALAGRMKRVPKIIFTAHGWTFNENRGYFSRISILFLHWLTVLLTHKTIAVSGKSKRDISWLPFMEGKVAVVHNGINEFKVKSRKEARLILAGGENIKRLIIFSASELHHNKGIDVALKALAGLPRNIRDKIIYCIAGTGQEKQDLAEMADKLGLKGVVRFLGFVDNSRELLAGVDIFLLPSRTEAMPYSVLEAGLAGLPIIATAVGGVPEIIDDMQNGILIQPRSPREVVEAIIYMIENPTRRKAFSSQIQNKINAEFSLDKMIPKTLAFYKDS